MKKFLLIVLLISSAIIGAQAQYASTLPLIQGDTLTNADTVSKVIVFTGGYSGIAIQPIVTKISGTVAGKVRLYESLDGVNYLATGDSLDLTNVTTNTAIFRATAPVSVYYKVEAISSGTQSSQIRIKYLARKYQE